MANLARFDPFSSLTRLDPFENVVRDLMPSMFRSMVRRVDEPAIAIEMQEIDNTYLVTEELTGVKKKVIALALLARAI